MNTLIITAHPSPAGHAHVIAKTYANAKKAKGHTVKIVDLYAKENREEFLTFTNIREMVPPTIQKTFEDQVAWAHEIVVVHPIWWSMPPAIMKNWVDLTFWVHFAYKFTPEGKIQKLLTGKTAKIFATSGGPAWFHYLPIMPLASFWKTSLFGFVGIDVVDMKICGNLDKWQGEKKEQHFQKFLNKIKESA
ncbi:MAG: NAD(P)H-dependent oxidoreductase [Candidatus Paceibacterota bacterium]